MSDRYPMFPEGTPSVTEVIKASGLMGYMPEDQYFLDRGKFVHEAIAMYLNGTLDEQSLAEGIKPYVESAILYIETTNYKATHVELPLMDSVYGFCGTIDAIPLIDWKNSGKIPWQSTQLSAYWRLCKVNDIHGGHKPMSVHLDKNGKIPKVQPYTMQDLLEGEKLFLSALYVYKWRKQHNLIKEKS
jgi:hypothetical protein